MRKKFMGNTLKKCILKKELENKMLKKQKN